ncbi:MAG: sulfurtransferase TusA family protein [Alphaproteobacteria bacterium]
MSEAGSRFLDIATEICPMTFVLTRLAIDELPPGGVLEVRLAAGEALENVPRAVTELGHRILGLEVEAGSDGRLYRIKIKKN